MSGVVKGLAAACVVLALAACAMRPNVTGPGYVTAGAFEFELLNRWSQIRRRGDPEIDLPQLTRSGPLLDRVMAGTLTHGRGIVTPGFEVYPRWWSGTPADALDGFFTESFSALGYEKVEVISKADQGFAGAPGVRYELTMERPGGLKIDGLALAARRGEQLDLIVFLAPREHYFPARLAEVEHVFKTAVRADAVSEVRVIAPGRSPARRRPRAGRD